MAIPRATIPKIQPPRIVAPPKIAAPEVPSIKVPGTSGYDYQNYLLEKQRRESWFFDTNNPAQVNSLADVIVNTAGNLSQVFTGEETLGSTLKQTVEDAGSLLYHGIIEPIKNKDFAALGVNQLVNISESIDVIDNIWKGALMGGKDGIKGAVMDRRNYNWDTGNGFMDFGLEVALSPTNLLTFGLGGLAKSTAKKAFTEAGVHTSKRMVKSFGRNYTGDATSTIAKMTKGMNLTPKDLSNIQSVAKHATNLKLLQSVNTLRTGVNFVDAIGPKLVYGSTFLPLKYLIKGGIAAGSMPLKYIVNAYNAVETDLTLMKIITNSPKYADAIKSISDAAKLQGIEYAEPAYEDIIQNVAKMEVKVFKDMYKQFNIKLNAAIKQEVFIDGQPLTLDMARNAHITNNLDAFIKELDQKAFELSGETYQTFDQYAATVAKIYHLHPSGASIGELYEYTSRLGKLREKHALSQISAELRKPIQKAKEITAAHRASVDDAIRSMRSQTQMELDALDDLILDVKRQYSDALKRLKRNPNDVDAYLLLNKLEANYGIVPTKNPGLGHIYPQKLHDSWDALNKSLDYSTGFDDGSLMLIEVQSILLETKDDMLNEVLAAYKELASNLIMLKGQGLVPEDWAKKAIKAVQSVQKAANKLAKKYEGYTFDTVNVAVNNKDLLDFGRNMVTLLEKAEMKLFDTMVDFSTPDTAKGFQKFLKKTMGSAGSEASAVKDMVDKVEAHLGKSRTTAQIKALRAAFVTGDTLNLDAVAAFAKQVVALTDESLAPLSRIVGTDLGTTLGLDDISFMYDDAIYRMSNNLDLLVQANPEQVANLADEILSDLHTIRDTIARSNRSMQDTLARAGRGELDNTGRFLYERNLQVYDELTDRIDDILNQFEPDDSMILQWTADNIRVYQLQFNAVYRNLHIMGSDTVQAMLDMIDNRTFDEALQAVDTMAFLDIRELSMLASYIGKGDMVEAAKSYAKLSPQAPAFTPDMADGVLALHDELSTLKEAATQVMDTLEGMASVRKFYAMVNDETELGTISSDLMYHFFDAIQWFHNKPANLGVGAELEGILTELKANINNQLRNQSTAMSFKLDDWKKHLFALERDGKIPAGALDHYRTMFPGDNAAHTAIADSYTEYLVRKYVLNQADIPDVKIVYSDLETNSLNAFGSVIHQQSVLIPEQNIYRWYINTKVDMENGMVNETALRLIFGDAVTREHSTEYLNELYDRIYRRGDVEALREFFNIPDGMVEIIPIAGERELIETVEAYVKGQTPDSGRLQLAMFNGSQYDVELLMNRRKELQLAGWINKGDILDTRLDLEEMFKLDHMTPQEEEAIEDLVLRYISIREGELSSVAGRRGMSIDDYNLLARGGKFMPSVDDTFRDSLKRLEEYFGGRNLTREQRGRTTTQLDDRYDLTRQLLGTSDASVGRSLDTFHNFVGDVNASLKQLGEWQDSLGELKLVSSKEAGFSQRLITEDMLKDIPEELQSKFNIGIDIMSTNRIEGMYVPIIAPKLQVNHNLVMDWFNKESGDIVPTQMLERMTKFGRDLDKTLSRLKNVDALRRYTDGKGNLIEVKDAGARALRELSEMHDLILAELRLLSGTTYMSPVLTDLRKGSNLMAQYAITKELWDVYTTVVKDMKLGGYENYPLYTKFKALYPDRADDVRFSRRILNGIMAEPSHARMFKLEPKDPDMQKVLAYYERQANLSLRTLQTFEDMQEETVNVARLKRITPVLRKLTESFRTAQDVANGTVRTEATYANMRMPVEAINEIIGYSKLVSVLKMGPEEMASYLWHHAKGLVMFKPKSLSTRNYFKRRNGLNSIDVLKSDEGIDLWASFLENKKAYANMGIDFKEHDGWIGIYLREDALDTYSNLPFQRIEADYDLTEVMDRFLRVYENDYIRETGIADGLRDVVRSILEARQHLLHLTPEGMGSTLEKVDRKVMEDLHKMLDVRFKGMLSQDTLVKHNRFAGNSYNHSILGSIDDRQKLMPFAAFNPAKTMFHATEFAHDRIAKQTQFAMLMQDPDAMLVNVAEDMTDQQIFEYMRNAQHLKLAFLQADAKKGFKLSTVVLRNASDVAFAKKVNAVVLDRNTYVKAYEILNGNALPDGLWKMLDHAIVAPFKIGWMAYNPGTVMRNLVDSAMKNLQSTGDLRIIPAMVVMSKEYWNYKSAIRDIYAIREKQNVKMSQALYEYFDAEGAHPAITREMFDLIEDFKNSGSSSGMVREAQQYYGDAIKRLYRRVKQAESGLTEQEFRKFMRMDDVEADAWLRRINSHKHAELMDVKRDLLVYKRAYAMHKLYPKKDISVYDFVTYLRRGNDEGFIPEELRPIISDLLDKTKNISVEESFFEKVMGHPIIDGALDWNAGIEEVIRLTMYKHLLDEGYNTSEAMAEIIKAHFDYGHKTQGQMYTEVIMPFSTFKLNSILYWTSALATSNMGMEIIAKGYSAASNINERDPEDIYVRRGLQYQMFEGNVVLDKYSGTTLKLSPSAIDAISFFANPVDYIMNSFHSLGGSVMDYLQLEPYKGESADSYELRKWKAGSRLIPILGPWLERARYDDDNNIVTNLLLAPLVNRTWTPEQRVIKPQYRYTAKSYTPAFRRQYVKKIRTSPPKNPGYSTFNRIYYGAVSKQRNNNTYMTKVFRSVNRAHSEGFRSLISSKGKSKWAMLMFPTNKYTLKMKVQLLRRMAHLGR